MTRRPLIAGNWKMNGLQAQRVEAQAMATFITNLEKEAGATESTPEVLVCPPFTLLADVGRDLAGSPLALGAQDCHPKADGAHTGDISAPMLAELGAQYAIVGHSERRALGETDALIADKALAAAQAGLAPIICVGETLEQRDAGDAEAVAGEQMAGSIPDLSEIDAEVRAKLCIAYEPVWAIGTGRTPSLGDIAAMHASLRAGLAEKLGAAAASVRLLYGGSVKPNNARDILSVADVDGALVGGASLTADSFIKIVQSAI